MTARTSRDAVQRHREHIQRVVSCVSDAFVALSEPEARVGTAKYSIALNNGTPLSLVRSHLTLRIVQSFATPGSVGSVGVRVFGYNYTLSHDRYGELFAYHWHHRTPETPAPPHLHVGAALVGTVGRVRTGESHKVHFPTALVSLESVLSLCIAEFGVEPRRRDWEQILSDAL